jgi:predicted transcriptional regulator
MAEILKKERTVWVSIPLDPETAARLQNLSDFCHAEPVKVAASLLHDILKDDEEYNLPAAISVGSATIN